MTSTPEQSNTPELQRKFSDFILVKVTPAGEKLWEDYHQPARIAIGKPEAYPLLRDDEGYTRIQLREVASVFGPAMFTSGDPPLDPYFKFER